MSDPRLTLAIVQADAGAVILKEINPLIQDGKYDEAISIIQKMTQGSEIENRELSSRYYNLTKMTKRTSDMLDCAVHHLELIIADKQKDIAKRMHGLILEDAGGPFPDHDVQWWY